MQPCLCRVERSRDVRILPIYTVAYARLPEYIGEDIHIQQGIRPIIIVSNNLNNRYSSVITVVSITSAKKNKHLPTHIRLPREVCWEIGLNNESTVLAETITSIPRQCVFRKIGLLQNEEIIEQVNAGIDIHLGRRADRIQK